GRVWVSVGWGVGGTVFVLGGWGVRVGVRVGVLLWTGVLVAVKVGVKAWAYAGLMPWGAVGEIHATSTIRNRPNPSATRNRRPPRPGPRAGQQRTPPGLQPATVGPDSAQSTGVTG